jgi:hypothetical protein
MTMSALGWLSTSVSNRASAFTPLVQDRDRRAGCLCKPLSQAIGPPVVAIHRGAVAISDRIAKSDNGARTTACRY